jgi:sugar phosphate isomerase/epimerase
MHKPPHILIGNQTAFSAASLRDPFDYALANGFHAFEWFPDKKPWGAGWDESNLDADARADIRHAAETRGIRLSVHARWPANPLSPDAWPAFLKDIELAEAIGAVLLNIHLCLEAGLEAYVKAVAPLVRRLVGTNLLLSIENSPETTPEHFNELFARLRGFEALRTDHVGMCLDIGHANLCAATRNDYVGYLDRLDPRVPIIHLHVHENWGDCDSHLPLFTGPAGRDLSGVRGFIERIRRRNYSGSIILEQWPHPPSLLNQAREGLRQLLAETDALESKL